MSSEIINATTSGIHTVFMVSLAARADVMTGAIISATTAGRIPMNIDEMTWLFLIISGVRNIAMSSMMTNDGSIVPAGSHNAAFQTSHLVSDRRGYVHGQYTRKGLGYRQKIEKVLFLDPMVTVDYLSFDNRNHRPALRR